jgi:PEP-CTERM motif
MSLLRLVANQVNLYQFKVWPYGTGPFGSFDVSDRLVMDVVSPDGTAAAHLEGFTSQVSSIDSERMSYEGVATLSASTSGRPGPQTVGTIYSPGPRGDFFGTYFDVRTPITAVLSLHAEVAGHGAFALYINNVTSGGVPVFFQSASDGADGPIIPSHEVLLVLGTGTYELRAELSGSAGLGEHGSFGAGFSLQALAPPVPEPQSWALLMTGAPLLASLAWRARRRGMLPPR